MKKSISLMAILLTFASSVMLGVNGTSKTVTAAAPSATVTSKNNDINDQAWSNKLAKAGYIFKLSKDVYTSPEWLYPSDSDKPAYSQKYAKKIYNKKMLFKIDQVKTVKNSASIHIVSKNKKYRFWTNFLNGTYNVYSRRKALKPVVKAEVKAIRTTKKEVASKSLAKAIKITAKLRGQNKKIAAASIVQLKKWFTNPTYANIPTLLIGSL